MKKILILCCIIALGFGATGATCKNFWTGAQDKVCNAPDSVLNIADIVINLLKPEAAALIPGSAPFIALVTAQGIKDTGCAALTGLNTMIAFIQGYNTQTKLAMKASRIKTVPASINIQPLVIWANSLK